MRHCSARDPTFHKPHLTLSVPLGYKPRRISIETSNPNEIYIISIKTVWDAMKNIQRENVKNIHVLRSSHPIPTCTRHIFSMSLALLLLTAHWCILRIIGLRIVGRRLLRIKSLLGIVWLLRRLLSGRSCCSCLLLVVRSRRLCSVT